EASLALLEEARELSVHCFDEGLDEVAACEGLSLALLVERGAEGSRSLRGYLCHRYHPPPRAELHVSRLAVPRRHRGRGHAGLLMRWALGGAARVPPEQLGWITVSSLETAVPFYARLGFVPEPGPKVAAEGSDPQTWMRLPSTSVIPRAPAPAAAAAAAPGPPPPEGQRVASAAGAEA
ncbi:unnamed protein product, partial [Prorocentrum cordatum]